MKPYSIPVIDRSLNNLSLKSYDISYRFSFPPEEHVLSGKQTFSTYVQSQVSCDWIKFSGARGKTWDAA